MSEGISYEFAVDANLSSLDAALPRLKAADSAIKGLGDSSEASKLELKQLRDQLADLKRPAEIAKLKEEIANIGKPVAETKKSLKSLHEETKEGFRGVGESIEHVKGKLNSFLEFTGIAIAIELVKKLTEHVVELGAEIVKAAAEEERTSAVFKLNFGVEDGEKALKYAEDFAAKGEFTEDQSKSFMVPLLKAGVPMKDMDLYLNAVGDVAAGYTDKIAGATAAVEAFSRMVKRGKLDGRSLSPLNIGIEQLRQLPEYAGKTTAQLKDILDKGTLTRTQVLRAIAEKDGVVGDKAVEMGKTMSAKLDKLQALPGRLYQEFMNASAFDVLKGKIDGILERFDPKSPGGQEIVKGIADLATALLHMTDGVNIKEVMGDVLGIMQAIPPVVDMMITGLKVVAQIVEGISFSWKSVKGFFKGEDRGNDGSGDYDPLTGMPMGSDGEETGKNYTDGLTKGIASGSPALMSTATDMASKPMEITKSVNEINSPSKVFERLGLFMGQGLAGGLAKSQGGIDDVMRGAFAIPASSAAGQAMVGGGGIQVEINVTVDGRGVASGRELGQQIAETIRPIVASELADAVERLNGAGGLA